MCMWFGFNPAINFCHFSTLLTLSVFAGVTSTSPKFDLFLREEITCRKWMQIRFSVENVSIMLELYLKK